jgi:hypothetical protein
MDTTTVSFDCPASGCSKSHTAVVKDEGHDRAETACSSCRNNIVAKTRDGTVVKTEVL